MFNHLNTELYSLGSFEIQCQHFILIDSVSICRKSIFILIFVLVFTFMITCI